LSQLLTEQLLISWLLGRENFSNVEVPSAVGQNGRRLELKSHLKSKNFLSLIKMVENNHNKIFIHIVEWSKCIES
jgi:hypothetical protein